MDKLKDILHISIGTISQYRAEQLYELSEQTNQQLNEIKKVKQWLELAIHLKYEERISSKRLRLDKIAGIIELEDDNYKLTSDVPKKIEWNQEKLAEIINTISSNGKNINDYADTNYSIKEADYSKWSQDIKNIFAPARSIKLSKPIYKLTIKNNNTYL